MNDQDIILILRLLHITLGVFWTGSVLFVALFLAPAVNASGAVGGKFLHQLGKTKYPIIIMVSALITILTGLLLIWKLSNGFQPAWFRSSYARVLTAGAGLSIIAFIIGFTVNRPAVALINQISDSIAKSGGSPTNEQMNELLSLRKRLFSATNIIAVLLTLTVISMSICRYVG